MIATLVKTARKLMAAYVGRAASREKFGNTQ